MEHNAEGLADVLLAAWRDDCPIVHISKLADEAPFIASRPCLGEHSAPLIEITPDGYLGLMAELRAHLIVEKATTLDCQIRTAGATLSAAASERMQLKPYILLGHLDMESAAVYYMMDSAGQETTVIYRGLASAAEMQVYWSDRGEICHAFSERFGASEEDLYALCSALDRTVDPWSIDLDAFARGRGLLQW